MPSRDFLVRKKEKGGYKRDDVERGEKGIYLKNNNGDEAGEKFFSNKTKYHKLSRLTWNNFEV